MSEKMIFVTPVGGLRVPNPYEGLGAKLPSAGAYVADSAYWRRRIKSGEVVQGLAVKDSVVRPSVNKTKKQRR